MIILKTTSQHVDGVRKNRKYATDDPPIDLKKGDDVLVQVTVLTSPGQHTIRFRMKYVRHYVDVESESLKIWGEKWRYIIQCTDLCLLKRPFDITRVRISDKDYGAAVRYAYVEPIDERELWAKGYLDCA